jgi:rhodanese-related sulfurtransferase
MGNTPSALLLRNINFEDLQYALQHSSPAPAQPHQQSLIINTLEALNQKCLIKGTLPAQEEEQVLNTHLEKNKKIQIIIYGMNASDYSIGKKYEQLAALGFSNVYIYAGGLFEWLLLQDIYGKEQFSTTTKEPDLLKYKGRQQFNVKMLCL